MTRVAIAVGLVAALVANCSADEVSPHEQLLEAWGEDFVGTWVGDETTLDSDTVGLGKKGDKTAVQGEIKPSSGVYQITWSTDVNGKLTNTGMAVVGWDASSKTITSHGFTKRGGTMTVTYTKRGKQWVTSRVSFDSDGTKGSQASVITVDEKTHTYEITNRKHGDKLLPDKKLVFRKK